ncbi:amino acid permease [Fodinibius halophilus]|uniref:Amino acid permease n=1 Tax=Fodinibius halophilus TaxID=1736908 RepID=A0A6M1TN68_9BACT|nr:amino acid permease [Fodinibius halophilus]NGP89800.1 amino acid permease [Fodinibius halophilus]
MEHEKLEKQLGLWDVYAIATGAMFSSGFFLLPGIAAAETGPSVFIAYLVSGLLVLPTMFSVAELATAMPKAGGTYYIIDRSLGPVMGTVGGYGSWLALVLKSAFALIGMGAYISIFIEVPIVPVAIVLTVVFGLLNIVGAKETTALQKVLVAALISIMTFYIAQGLFSVFSVDFFEVTRTQFTPLFINGATGFWATVGMVFVSYAGLTKVASVAEEVRNPDRNIPWGMFLSIMSAIFVYVAGVFIMVSVLDPTEFRQDLTPVATAGEAFMSWLPGDMGILLVVIAAVAAFASTGNAGIMSASRYPLAMARDKLIDKWFSKIGTMGTPVIAIIATVFLMIFFLVAFDVAEVAKLASAFQLMLFALLNLAVIVMRESKIEEYDPGFNSPFYPWIQIAGMILSAVLILEMGLLSIIFTVVVSIFSVGWFYYYAYGKIDREGAIFHVTARLGKRKDYGLEREMRGILREKGLREEDPYEQVVAQAEVIDEPTDKLSYTTIIKQASDILAKRLKMEEQQLVDDFCKAQDLGTIPLGNNTVINHIRVEKDCDPQMVLVRIPESITVSTEGYEVLDEDETGEVENLCAMIFLVSSSENSSQHLRIIAHLAEMIGSRHFIERWNSASNESELREILLRDERFINITITKQNSTRELIGKKIMEVDLPGESLITILKRNGDIKIPHGSTVIEENDQLSIIGDIEDIEVIKEWRKSVEN